MSNFNIGDKVIYLPTKDEGKIIAKVNLEPDCVFESSPIVYIFESILTKKIQKVVGQELKHANKEKTPAEEFAKLDEEAKQFRLMQTMQRCQEVFAMLEAEGKIDSEKVGSIDWYDESKFKIELCIEYEKTYCGTDVYEENYSDSTEQFFRVKLLERFGIKPKKKIFEVKIIGEHDFFIEANDIDDVYNFLYAHENDDRKDYLKTEFVAYNEETKVSEYHGARYDIAAVLEEGGVQ